MEKLSQAVLDNAPIITEALLRQVDLCVYLHIFGILAGLSIIVVGFIFLKFDMDGFQWFLAAISWITAFVIVTGNVWWIWVALENPIYYAMTLLIK